MTVVQRLTNFLRANIASQKPFKKSSSTVSCAGFFCVTNSSRLRAEILSRIHEKRPLLHISLFPILDRVGLLVKTAPNYAVRSKRPSPRLRRQCELPAPSPQFRAVTKLGREHVENSAS